MTSSVLALPIVLLRQYANESVTEHHAPRMLILFHLESGRNNRQHQTFFTKLKLLFRAREKKKYVKVINFILAKCVGGKLTIILGGHIPSIETRNLICIDWIPIKITTCLFQSVPCH